MEAILYICHGSRVKEASAQAIDFIKVCMQAQPYSIQEYCFLELETPTIEEAYERCIQKGAVHVLHPMLGYPLSCRTLYGSPFLWA